MKYVGSQLIWKEFCCDVNADYFNLFIYIYKYGSLFTPGVDQFNESYELKANLAEWTLTFL